ncbi:hypothetical protein BDV29DRAFT_183183 [Aspergillus leporis]|uniref:Subtelomeric hrmA-associated cluster protein AFUB-079030/YDR124W-like helical bundle domain-containing protein n=1 Tax=Aspergillus leporis TaxID=41062 RepID=A0A5N5WKY3_9EURO|nr:hypothetical protein BDV29DRAFT_183183 [Aspergillus leporis]
MYLPDNIFHIQIPYPSDLDIERGLWIIKDPLNSTQLLIFRCHESDRIRSWYRKMLSTLVESDLCRIVGALERYVEPHRAELYPYDNDQRIPSWWPRHISYKIPSRLQKKGMIAVIARILFPICPHGLRAKDVALALQPVRKNCSTRAAEKILDAIISVRVSEERCLGRHFQPLSNECPLAASPIRTNQPGAASMAERHNRIHRRRPVFNVNIPGVVHMVFFGVYESGRFFRYVSTSLNKRNIRLSDAEKSFELEVKRVEEGRKTPSSR